MHAVGRPLGVSDVSTAYCTERTVERACLSSRPPVNLPPPPYPSVLVYITTRSIDDIPKGKKGKGSGFI